MEGTELTMNEQNQVITYTDYKLYKQELDAELQKNAEGFVKIGYLLKVARDTGILAESGYQNVNDFAEREYNLDKSAVSRFMRINDKFSKDGYSEELADEFKGYGYAKLSIMLTLPDGINEILSPEMSKSEIKIIQEEVKQEQEISDVEVLLEEKDERQQALSENILKIAYQIGYDDADLYMTLFDAAKKGCEDDALINLIAPGGIRVISTRIPGLGRAMVSIKEDKDEIGIRYIRSEERETYTKAEFAAAFKALFKDGTAKESFKEVYGGEAPKNDTVAPVQQKKETRVTPAKKPENKEPVKQVEKHVENEQMAAVPKEITLHDIAKEIPMPDPVEEKESVEDAEVAAVPEETEEQIPGQDEITNHPEYMPDESRREELFDRLYKLTHYTLDVSVRVWQGKVMPLETIQRNKEHAKELVRVLEELEQLVGAEEGTNEEKTEE